MTSHQPVGTRARPARADAQRNRERILRVAAEAFAVRGLDVPVHEIARRAGVGTGTVSRHFPTKEALFAAVLLDRMRYLSGRAAQLAAGADPGAAFRTFFATLVHEGAAHRGLAQALSDEGFAHLQRSTGSPVGRLFELLAAAQQAGAVRTDIGPVEVRALLHGCLAHDAALDPMIDVITTGLRP